MNIEQFLEGNETEAYTFFGCHLEKGGAVFRIFAPGADAVSLIGEFNGWTETPMNQIDACGIYAVFVLGVQEGQMYKYKVHVDGTSADYSDPYGYGMELRPASASIVRNLTNDSKYCAGKTREDLQVHFQNVYEMHIGSFKKNGENWHRFSEFGEDAADYLTEYHYDSVCLLPFMEYDNDKEGGFAPTGFFAPSARFGTVEDCRKMIDRFHQKDISVMFEFPWEHFSKAYYGLTNVAGCELYGSDGTFHINHGAVGSFLCSAVIYWLKEYHLDGVKFVLSDNQEKNWFVEKLCKKIHEILPEKIIYIESVSSAQSGKNQQENSIQMLRNDIRWSESVLSYFGKNVWERNEDTSLLNVVEDSFETGYGDGVSAQSDRVLELSLRTLQRNRATVIEKMSGNYDEKFAQARALYLYRMMCKGRKLDFMGNELAHFRMWEADREQDWNLLDFEKHVKFTSFIQKLNEIVANNTIFVDASTDISVSDLSGVGSSFFSIERKAQDTQGRFLAIYNFSADMQKVPLEKDCNYTCVLDSNDLAYGGTDARTGSWTAKRALEIAPLSAMLFEVHPCDDSQLEDDESQDVCNVSIADAVEPEVNEPMYTENCIHTEKEVVSPEILQVNSVNEELNLIPWYDRSVFYHIYPLGFTGAPEYNEGETTKGHRILQVLDWIPHLNQLGVNAVYFGPVFESGWHGYDTYDYYHVDSRLGSNEDLKRVIASLHENGIRVVLDGVFNHVGRGFAPFKDVQENGVASHYKDWFSGVNFGGRSAGGDAFSYDTWAGNFELVKLNLYNEEVVQHLLGAVQMWIEEFGIDGLRLDAADCIDKNFFKRLKSFTKEKQPDFWLMGEIIHGDYNMWANDEMMDSVTNYECWKGIYSSHNDKNYFEIAHSLNRQFAKGGIYEGKHFYNFLDNHDVNRIASLLKDKRDLANAYTLMFLMPGIPSIYYGSEWGIDGVKTSGREADRPIRPSMEEIQGRTRNYNLAAYISQLSKLRKSSKVLAYGGFENVIIRNQQYVFARFLDDEWILAAFNISEQEEHFSFNYRGKDYSFKLEPHANIIM